jgi:hypothetical protein
MKCTHGTRWRFVNVHVDIENKTVLYYQIICYRLDTIRCTGTVGCGSRLEERGTRLENIVRCVPEAT